jgi:hypothetical protein
VLGVRCYSREQKNRRGEKLNSRGTKRNRVDLSPRAINKELMPGDPRDYGMVHPTLLAGGFTRQNGGKSKID